MLNTKDRYIYLLPLCCLMIIFILKSANRPADDYAGYYFGSRFFLEGLFNAPTIYETYAFNHKIFAEGYNNLLVSYTPFPPITSLFFIPFTWFDLYTSKIIFNCLSSFVFLFSLLRIMKFLNIPNWVYMIIPLVFLIPIRNNIYFGQAYLILFSMMIEGFIFYKKGRYFYASLLWGPAIVLKIFPLICLFFLLFKKEWRQMLYLAGVTCGLLVSSFYFNGLDVWKTYMFEIFPRVSNGELNDAFTPQFQSMFMFLKNIFVADELQNPFPPFDNPQLFILLNLCFKIIVLSFCASVSLNKRIEDLEKFGIWVIGSILISPNGSTYSLILLMIPFFGFCRIEKNNSLKGFLILILLLISNLQVNAFFSLPAVFQFPRLILTLGLFIFLIYLYSTSLNYKVLLGFSLLFVIASIPALQKKDNDNSTYFFHKNNYTLIYDYIIKDNKLAVFYYNDDKGAKSDTLNFEQPIKQDENIYLKNHQIYWRDDQLTDTDDRKMKPVLLSSGRLLYLSDKNRGVGFYTLRTKKIF